MCFGPDAAPPIAEIAGAAVDGRRIELVSEDGTRFFAFAGEAAAPTASGMLILPDVRGLHRYYEELALRFAEAGVDALAIDYFGRTTKTTDRGSGFDHKPHVAKVEYEAVMADAAAAVEVLRGRGESRAIFSVGFCFGGRMSFLAATRPELRLNGVIGFYGWPLGPSRTGPLPVDVVAEMRCPVLGIFGGADHGIPAHAVAAFAGALGEAGVEHQLMTYPGAPHSFFDRRAEQFADASADAWGRVLEFVRQHTPA